MIRQIDMRNDSGIPLVEGVRIKTGLRDSVWNVSGATNWRPIRS